MKNKILWIPVRIATTGMVLYKVYQDTRSAWLIFALILIAVGIEAHNLVLSMFIRIVKEHAEIVRGENGKG